MVFMACIHFITYEIRLNNLLNSFLCLLKAHYVFFTRWFVEFRLREVVNGRLVVFLFSQTIGEIIDLLRKIHVFSRYFRFWTKRKCIDVFFFFLLFSINTILDRTIYLVQNLTETVQYKQVILPNFLFFFLLRKSGITLRFFFVLTYFCNLHFPLEFTTCFVPRIVVINSNNLVFAKSHTISLSRLFEKIISN